VTGATAPVVVRVRMAIHLWTCDYCEAVLPDGTDPDDAGWWVGEVDDASHPLRVSCDSDACRFRLIAEGAVLMDEDDDPEAPTEECGLVPSQWPV